MCFREKSAAGLVVLTLGALGIILGLETLLSIMSSLIVHACSILTAGSSVDARRVAAATLSAAIDQGIALPAGAPRLLWRFALCDDPSTLGTISMSGLGRVVDDTLCGEIVAAMVAPEAGTSTWDAGMQVLGHEDRVGHISVQDLKSIVEVAANCERAYDAGNVIRGMRLQEMFIIATNENDHRRSPVIGLVYRHSAMLQTNGAL